MARKKSSAAIKSSGATSSKAAPLPDWVKGGGPKPPPKTAVREDGTAQLFPPGSKTPLNLMYEKIQKMPGFEKPEVSPRQHKHGYSCVITLRKVNKQDKSNPHTLRMEPLEEGARLSCASALEAKHWAATYVLFRLYNHLSMNRMLPPGPREYWLELEKVKAQSPASDGYKWEPDPFDALQKRDAEREARKKEHEAREAQRNDPTQRPMSKVWQRALEVRMAPALRELVEATIRARMDDVQDEALAEATEQVSLDAPPLDVPALERALAQLGVRPGYIGRAVAWLREARAKAHDAAALAQLQRAHPLLASVLALPDREAAIEYLVLYTPEQDLPPALRPTAAAESFVTSAAKGGDQESLVDRWTLEKLVRHAGFPHGAAAAALAEVRARGEASIPEREGAALDVLLRRMIAAPRADAVRGLDEETRQRRADERTVLEALIDGVRAVPERERIAPGDLDLPLGVHEGAPVSLRFVDHDASAYLAGGTAWPTVYVAGASLPAFLRLALTRHAMQCLADATQPGDVYATSQSGEGVLYVLWEALRAALPGMLEAPPALDAVMEHLVDAAPRADAPAEGAARGAPAVRARAEPRRARALERDASEDAALREQLAALRASLKYQESIGPVREALPAYLARADVLEAVRASRVVLVAGETGCGKTTQVPQLLLDEAIEAGRGSECSIVVTQPRRVSAMGVAARVAAERGEALEPSVGERATVGYAIRGERRASRHCRLLFSTTGVLLRRLASGSDPALKSVSHVIVDEVHERSTDSDFLLLLLRDVLARNPRLKVVLMSATIDPARFVAYFGGAPYLSIPGRTFPVQEHYLEDIVRLAGYQSARPHTAPHERVDRLFAADAVPEALVPSVRQLVAGGRIDYEFLAHAVALAARRAEKVDYTGTLHGRAAILVFCPGVGEIRRAMDAIAALQLDGAVILPLHANLAPGEQRRVFQPVARAQRKIVVATNVAETSITIPEIGFVVDTGRVREATYDAAAGVTRLQETWASRAACKQRAGRAGRTMAGECFKLYTRAMATQLQAAHTVPEMQRTPLEGVVLQVKAIQPDGDVQAFLERALDPPPLDALAATHRKLVAAGAIHGGGYAARLTPLGQHLVRGRLTQATLPLDVREGKMLVLGSLFGCLEPLLHVVALLASRPIVAPGAARDEDAARARAAYALGNSDLLSDAHLYAAYLAQRREKRGTREVKAWCDTLGLSFPALQDVDLTRATIARSLEERGLVDGAYLAAWRRDGPQWPRAAGGHALDAYSTNLNLLRAVLVAALWPSLARVDQPAAKFNASASGAVQREAAAREVHYYDEHDGRVFLHPGSTLFHATRFKSNYVAVCRKSASDTAKKTFLRDATEAPLYGLLLLGGALYVDHAHGGLTVATDGEAGPDAWVKLRASARIGVLCRQLRQLLAHTLEQGVEDARALHTRDNQAVVRAMVALVTHDGLD